jgi:tryptophan synthase alpha chain
MHLQENRIVKAFSERAAAGKKNLLPFLTAGYPDVDTTAAMLRDFEARGCVLCELGIPYSDPIADGPVIQASMTAALQNGLKVADIFTMVRAYRDAGGAMGLLAMLSYSIVFRRGPAEFCRQAAEAGFDGLIVPDLPLDEAAAFEEIARQAGLCNVMLTSPTTPQDRRIRIARHTSGFLYYMSVAGITGERKTLPPETLQNVAELRTHTDAPICVGFGISSGAMVEEVCRSADGAIVGSAIIHKITDAMNAGADRDGIVRSAGEFVTSLLKPLG